MVKEKKMRENCHTFLESIKEKDEQGRDKDFTAFNFHAMKMYG